MTTDSKTQIADVKDVELAPPPAAPGQEEAAPIAPPSAEAEEVIDWKARHEAATADLAAVRQEKERLAHQLSSNQGILKQRLDLEAALNRVQRRLEHQGEVLQALAARQATGEVESLPGDIAGIASRYEVVDQQESTQATVKQLWSDLLEECEEAKLDPFKAPELAGMRALWDVGIADPVKNRRSLDQALREGKRVRLEAQTARHAAELRAKEEEVQERLRKAGVLETPVPTAAGRGRGGQQELVNRLGRGEAMTVDEMKQAQSAMAQGTFPQA